MDKHSGPQNVQLQELLASRADSASHYHDSVQKIDCHIHTVIPSPLWLELIFGSTEIKLSR